MGLSIPWVSEASARPTSSARRRLKPRYAAMTPKSTKAQTAGGYCCGFRPKYCNGVRALIALGRTDEEIRLGLGIAESTWELWQLDHPEFREACTRTKEQQNLVIELAVVKRAI